LRYIWLTAQKKQLLNSWKEDKRKLEQQRERALAKAFSGDASVGSSRDARDSSELGVDFDGARDLARDLEEKAAVSTRVVT
jgi:hypothetical protein